MPIALYAPAAGAFGIGVTEFVIMGLLLEVGNDLGVSISAAGLLISGNALGAWLGGVVIEHGPGLGSVTLVAGLVSLAAIATALFGLRADPQRRRLVPPTTACPEAAE